MLTAQDVAALQRDPVSDYRARRLRPYGMVDSSGALTPLGARIAFHMPRTRNVDVHVLAVLKNAVEQTGDEYRHFGALIRYGEFVEAAVDWELLAQQNQAPTRFGAWFYSYWNLATLPDTRANRWQLSPQLALVLRLLDGRGST